MTALSTLESVGPDAAPTPSAWKGEMLVGVSGHFSAAHKDTLTGDVHGHTWLVTAWFSQPGRSDARCHKAALDAVIALWDHKLLPDKMAWGEDIACAVATLANVVEVEISRPAEGLHTRFRPTPATT